MRRFAFTFLILQIFLFAVAELRLVQQQMILPWTALLVQTCVALVTAFDADAAALGKVIWNPTNGFNVSIEPGCSGVEAYLVLVAAVLAFPSTWRLRWWGLTLGAAAVHSLNIVRVISLFYLGQWDRALFDFAHTYLWQGLIMLDVLVFWLFWARSSALDGATRHTRKGYSAPTPAAP